MHSTVRVDFIFSAVVWKTICLKSEVSLKKILVLGSLSFFTFHQHLPFGFGWSTTHPTYTPNKLDLAAAKNFHPDFLTLFVVFSKTVRSTCLKISIREFHFLAPFSSRDVVSKQNSFNCFLTLVRSSY